VNAPAPSPTAARWLWLSALVIGLDQASKALIVAHFELFERRAVLPVLEITRLHNKGAAFSFLSDASGWQHYLFLALAALLGRREISGTDHATDAGAAALWREDQSAG